MSGDQAPAPCPHPFDELNERLREGFRALAEALAPLAAFGSKPAPRVSAAPSAPNTTGPEGEAGDEADRAAADRTALRDRIAALFRHPPGQERLGDATPGEIADAVLTEIAPDLGLLDGMRQANLDAAAAALQRAERAEAAVRAIHYPITVVTTRACHGCTVLQATRVVTWPCPTIAALDPPATPTGEDGT